MLISPPNLGGGVRRTEPRHRVTIVLLLHSSTICCYTVVSSTGVFACPKSNYAYNNAYNTGPAS